MCAVAAFFCVPMPAASILFDVMPCVVSTLIVDGKNECGLSSSRGWQLMDRHLFFVLGWLIALFSGGSSSSRSRAFGLLNCRHLEQSLHLVSNTSGLGVRWLWHVALQHCCCHYILACSREMADRLLWLCVPDDLSVYLSSASADTSARRVGQVLLEDLPKQDEALTILVKLGLELS